MEGKDILRFSILTGLQEEPSHGYKLIKWLVEMGSVDGNGPVANNGYIYRAMNKMEQEKLVASTWTKPTRGPAAKEYAITILGEQWLKEQAYSFGNKILSLSNIYNVYNTER
jgi:DNA-binding PadR family transcriptional regulator